MSYWNEMISTKKKKRCSNFSKEEELFLLQLVEKNKSIIECKTTNKITNAEKENTWLKIFAEFSSKNTLTNRTLEQLKSKYDNLKTKARKELILKKEHIERIGGGGPINYELDIITETMLRILNLKAVVEMENNLGSDYTKCIPNSYNCDSQENTQCVIQNGDELLNYADTSITYTASISSSDISIIDADNQHKETNTEELIEEEVEIKPTPSPERNKTPEESSNSTECVPKKRKLSPNKFRHVKPDTFSEVIENFYKRKLELLEKSYEAESINRQRREAREQEEHEKRMKLLDMEILLKEKKLQEMH